MRKTEILCQCCSGIAVVFDEGRHVEDGLIETCDECGVLGRVEVDCDEVGTYVQFTTLTKSELYRLENTTLLNAYIKNQEIIDRLQS